MTKSYNQISLDALPQHLAIIMDGNGRWAIKQDMPRFYGHKKGVENLRKIVKSVMDNNIPYLTIWAFSTENWRRPIEEVNYLIDLLHKTLEKDIDEFHQKDIRLNIIGLRDKLSPKLCKLIDKAMALTKKNKKLYLTIAFNYGGRADLTQAFQQIAQKIATNVITTDDIDQQLISTHLMTANLPDPDFIIRTGDVQRLSNFMMWQCGYSELYFSSILWPEFTSDDLTQALIHFQNIERRFGRVKN